MAKAPSKIMSIADKKAAQANLKTAIKQQADLAKTIATDLKAAAAALALAKKTADAQTKEAAKQAATVAKAADITLKAAQKAYDAAVATANKKGDAAAKGASKLKDQMAALDAVPTSAPVKAVKVKAPADQAALV